ncbi:MAG: neuromedin U [Deltaproteobacteria bacterium]|nr:neuromedin U [Deltaproteobacteria bacterium]
MTDAEMLALAKKAQNPIANMRSFKFQNNTNLGLGPDDSTQNMLNLMPILPFKLTDDILVITRTILPVVSQPDFLTPIGEGRVDGIGDASFQAFFSPMQSDVTWGVGPSFLIPTASDDSLGSEKWGAGISAILLDTPGRWVYGGIVSNVWSTGGTGEKDVNLLTLQYFINYNFDHGWYVMTSPIITADWEADSDHRWTVPIGLGFGKLFKVGSQNMTAQVSGYSNIITPDDYGAEWQVRAMLMFMFPKGK